MSDNLNKLYPEIIKYHAEKPYHFEKHERASFQAYNPLCGDKFDVYVQSSSKQKLDTLYFYGFGCAISKASTSIMSKTLEGQSIDEAIKTCDNFLRYIEKELTTSEKVRHSEFQAFAALHEFTARRACAALPWREMKTFLELKKNN